MTQRSPFRYFRTNSEIICLAVMMYVRFPLSLRNVEDLLHERGIEVGHEGLVRGNLQGGVRARSVGGSPGASLGYLPGNVDPMPKVEIG
jgi:hypothetical protein